jgi:inhibitor of cysteine peptidase
MLKAMKRISIMLFVITSVLVPIIGCSSTGQVLSVEFGENILTFSYENAILHPVQIAPGTVFKVALPSNPTTGYQWFLEGIFDLRFVKLLSEDYTAPSTELVGAGGTQVFTFETLAVEGLTSLNFAYYRSWEGVQSDTQLFTIHLYVKK